MVVTELPPDDAKRALEALCIPVITPLQVSVQTVEIFLVKHFLLMVLLSIFCSIRKLSIKVQKA